MRLIGRGKGQADDEDYEEEEEEEPWEPGKKRRAAIKSKSRYREPSGAKCTFTANFRSLF
jgi:hypothetical protein